LWNNQKISRNRRKEERETYLGDPSTRVTGADRGPRSTGTGGMEATSIRRLHRAGLRVEPNAVEENHGLAMNDTDVIDGKFNSQPPTSCVLYSVEYSSIYYF